MWFIVDADGYGVRFEDTTTPTTDTGETAYETDYPFNPESARALQILERTGVSLGTGDGTETRFDFPNVPIAHNTETIYEDAVSTTAITMDYESAEVTFDAAVGNGVAVTADYTAIVSRPVAKLRADTYEIAADGIDSATVHITLEDFDSVGEPADLTIEVDGVEDTLTVTASAASVAVTTTDEHFIVVEITDKRVFPIPNGIQIKAGAPSTLNPVQQLKNDVSDLRETSNPFTFVKGGALFYHLFFESLDGYSVTEVNGGTVAFNSTGGYVEIKATTASTQSHAGLEFHTHFPANTATWDKRRRFLTRARIENMNSTTPFARIGMGNTVDNSPGTDEKVCFLVSGGDLDAEVADGSARTTVEIISTIGTPITHKLEIDFHPGDRADFYVDDVLQASITTNLPSGQTNALRFFGASIQNTATAANRSIRLSEVIVEQQA